MYAPHEAFAAVAHAMKDMGYETELSVPFQVQVSQASDEASIRAEVVGHKTMRTHYSVPQGLWGISSATLGLVGFTYSFSGETGLLGSVVLVLSIVLILFGIALVATGLYTRELCLVVSLDGKTRFDKSGETGNGDTIADIRVVLGATDSFSVSGTGINNRLVCKPYDPEMEHDFASLKLRIESLLPSRALEPASPTPAAIW